MYQYVDFLLMAFDPYTSKHGGKNVRPLIVFKINFSKKKKKSTNRVPNSLDLDQVRHSVGPDLGPNCLQRLPAKTVSS